MADTLTDADIQRLLHETKPLPGSYQDRIRLKPKRGHKEAELQMAGLDGSAFRLVLRQNNLDPLDFSVIVGYEMPNTNVSFRLCRYNGKSHQHTNKLERQTFFDYHIHQATQRYQELGLSEDAYAQPTDRYADVDGALQCALQDCCFELPPDSQLALFADGGAQ
jgi:hypothetical protein